MGRASPILEEATRRPPYGSIPLLVGSCFALFRIFLHFFRIFPASEAIMAFFINFFPNFHRFREDFEWSLGGFWEDFSKIFRIS